MRRFRRFVEADLEPMKQPHRDAAGQNLEPEWPQIVAERPVDSPVRSLYTTMPKSERERADL